MSTDSLAPFDRDAQFDRLVAMMQRVRPLALIGAGASIGSGYPTWSQLLQQLQKELRDKSPRAVPPKLARVVNHLQDPAWQAEEYYNALQPIPFNDFLSRTFAQREPAEPYHLLARMGFRHVLTTNFESCAEDAFRKANPNCRVRRLLWSRDRDVHDFFAELAEDGIDISVVHLHGHVSDPASIVLKESDYSRTYMREENRRRLIALFMTQPILFVGFSMNDPDLGQIMREVLFSLPRRFADPTTGTEVGSPPSGRHFALFGYRTIAERDLIRRRMDGKFGLETVFYRIVPTADGKSYRHDNLLSLLEAIARAAPPRGLSSPANGARTRGVAAPSPKIARAGDGNVLVVPADGDSLVPPRTESDGEDLFELDPNKGAFGGAAKRDGLTLLVSRIEESSGWVQFDVEVRARRDVDFEGAVTFHYHPTFSPQTESLAIRDGQVRTTLEAVGAFTVGAEYRGTRLELDLSDNRKFPKWFRES